MVRPAAILATIAIAGSLFGCVRPAAPPVTPSVKPPDTPGPSAPVDFARVRTEYGDRKDFFDICERERPLNRLSELIGQQRWDEVLAMSEPWLQKCPVDIDVRLVTAVALKGLGSPLESEHHARWFRGLVDSILASGDGRTPETAFVVISVPEEYSVLRALRMRPTSQSLSPGFIDALSVVSDKGDRGVIYFNPAAHFRRLKGQLGAPW
jgi:hypothetical protein